jgi:MYXO-CTERM domain-containing protein
VLGAGDIDADGRTDIVATISNDFTELERIFLGRAASWLCPATGGRQFRDSKVQPVVRLAIATTSGGNLDETWTITVTDVAPTMATLAATVAVVPEGFPATIHGTWSDPGAPETITLAIDWGDGETDEVAIDNGTPGVATALDASHTFGDEGSYVVTVTPRDDEGAAGSGRTATINVLDHAPSITAVPTNSPVEAGTEATVWIVAEGVEGDTLVYDVDWSGDGDFDDAGDVSGSPDNMHAYARPDAATVTVNVQVRDDEGNVAASSATIEWTEPPAPEPEDPPPGDGGCCSTGAGGAPGAGLLVLVVALALRRRR